MGDAVTKNPQFNSDAEIQQENDRRKKSIELFLRMPADQIRSAIACSLDTAVGKALTSPPGDKLYVNPSWLVRPEDSKELASLQFTLAMLSSADSDPGFPSPPSEQTIKQMVEIYGKIEAIYRRGSDHLRASVGRAATWACVPAEMLAAVLQNENSPKASEFQRTGQSIERTLQSWIGYGSTGFGNVKPDTLSGMKDLFQKYYKSTVLGPGVKNTGQNDNAETDIFHAAAVLRDGLNKAWSAGSRSLNAELSKKFLYYPYFGGTVTADVATRAMGHYNGMGDGAKTYGEMGLYRIQKQKLSFLPPQ